METIILKLGGSVITEKEKGLLQVRTELVRSIALTIKTVLSEKNSNLIIIHGAGSFGHVIAKKHKLHEGTIDTDARWQAVAKTHLLCQQLNTYIATEFIAIGLPVFPIHPLSIITCAEGTIEHFDTTSIDAILKNNHIPILYGDMVFDSVRGAVICSGDQIAPYLARHTNATRLLFASDIDGIFSEDPHVNPHAQLIPHLDSKQLNDGSVVLGASHNEDVTGGLAGKMAHCMRFSGESLQEILIFNGTKKENYALALRGDSFRCTRIRKE
ncbi:MAG: isopentenyl phosphate kinase [bacterium]|nr:isopentenyl phosphate kinase [bacterium]